MGWYPLALPLLLHPLQLHMPQFSPYPSTGGLDFLILEDLKEERGKEFSGALDFHV